MRWTVLCHVVSLWCRVSQCSVGVLCCIVLWGDVYPSFSPPFLNTLEVPLFLLLHFFHFLPPLAWWLRKNGLILLLLLLCLPSVFLRVKVVYNSSSSFHYPPSTLLPFPQLTLPVCLSHFIYVPVSLCLPVRLLIFLYLIFASLLSFYFEIFFSSLSVSLSLFCLLHLFTSFIRIALLFVWKIKIKKLVWEVNTLATTKL